MKKNSLFLLPVILIVYAGNILVQAQKTTSVRQEIIANGGKFESVPPFTDYVTVESYDLSTLAVTIFNTIYTQSVQDVLISGNHAYVTASDSVVMYNIDNYQRLAAVRDSGVNKMALYNNRLIVTKQYPIGRFRVEVLDANDLGLIAFVDGIPGDCQGVAVYGDHAYVAVDSGYAGVEGRLAIINTSGWTLDTIVNFGPSAIGIYSVYSYGGFIYCVNWTPFGGGNIGSITQFNPSTNTFITNTMAVNIGEGYGIKDNLLYLGMNNSIGSYNLDTQAIADTTIINYSGSPGNIEIHSVGVDYINNKFYTNVGNRTSFGIGVVFSLAGDSLTSYSTGINADACAIDFRNPTGIPNTGTVKDAISIYPNPTTDFIGINLSNTNSTLIEIKILDLTGRTIETRPVRKGENNIRIRVSDYPSGVYMISFTTDQGTKVRKFIKR
jgi:Secretion system C-terminal sorting domain/LVIVD repeat